MANTRLIAELGVVKDGGFLVAGLARAWHDSGAAAGRKKALRRTLELLGTAAQEHEAVAARAGELYEELGRLGLLRAFVAELRAC